MSGGTQVEGVLCEAPHSIICPRCGITTTVTQSCSGCERPLALHGRYLLARVLGATSLGTTWLAWDTARALPVVVKTVASDLDGPSVAAFHEAAVRAATLRHPGLPAVEQYFGEEWGGAERVYLVYDYIPGTTLAEALAAGERFSEEQVVDLARQLSHILAYLHAQQPPAIHRDIKPANVVRRPDGTIALIDFDLLSRPDGPEGPGRSLGTPGYAPAEQYWGPVGPDADLYAVGATMLALLAPAEAGRPSPSNEERLGSVSPALRAVVRRLLAPDREARYASAADVTAALGALEMVSNTPSDATPAGAQTIATADLGAKRIFWERTGRPWLLPVRFVATVGLAWFAPGRLVRGVPEAGASWRPYLFAALAGLLIAPAFYGSLIAAVALATPAASLAQPLPPAQQGLLEMLAQGVVSSSAPSFGYAAISILRWLIPGAIAGIVTQVLFTFLLGVGAPRPYRGSEGAAMRLAAYLVPTLPILAVAAGCGAATVATVRLGVGSAWIPAVLGGILALWGLVLIGWAAHSLARRLGTEPGVPRLVGAAALGLPVAWIGLYLATLPF